MRTSGQRQAAHPIIAVCVLGPVFAVAVTVAVTQETRVAFPVTRRVDQVDMLHGTKVEDPYRWLEADLRTAKEVADWVAAQNKITAAYLASVPQREPIKRRLTELWNYEKIEPPRQVAGRFYVFNRNDGLQNHGVLYTAETPDAEPKVLLDPNTWSRDGSSALAGTSFSVDGKYLAYGVAESGSDWISWKVLEVATRRLLADELKWIRFGGASWSPDSKGFYYSRFPESKPGEKHQAIPRDQKVYYHRLGTSQRDDVLVYERPDQPNLLLGAWVTSDGHYLVIFLREGGRSRNTGFLYRDLREPGDKLVKLIDPPDAIYRVIGNDGPVFYLQTDQGAPRGPGHRPRYPHARPQGLEDDHRAGGRDAQRGGADRRPVPLQLLQGCPYTDQGVLARRGVHPRAAAAGHRHRGRHRRQPRRHRVLLHVPQLRDAADHLPPRPDHR